MVYTVTATNERTKKDEKFEVAGNYLSEKSLSDFFNTEHGTRLKYKSVEPAFATESVEQLNGEQLVQNAPEIVIAQPPATTPIKPQVTEPVK